MFEYHQIPFQAAIDVGVAATMPSLSIYKGQTQYDPEQVGAAFSSGLITEYLKQAMGFTGMVTSEWGTMSSQAHGVEMLTPPERVAKFVKAGSHQLGSDSYTLVQQAYDQGLLGLVDIDGAAVKILEMSFKLGIFENPYVDAAAAASIVRSPQHRTNGFIAQKKAIVLLKNREHTSTSGSAPRYLPIDGTRYSDLNASGTPDPGEYICDTDDDGIVQIYYDGVVDDLAGTDYMEDVLGVYDYRSEAAGTALAVVRVESPADADIAVLRITARKGQYFGLDAGVPLSFDRPFPGTGNDGDAGRAIKDRNKVIDLLRVRDGFINAAGDPVDALKPTLKIVLVMHMDRPSIVKPFLNGLDTLDETLGIPGSYPLVSDPANIRADGFGGADAILVEFGAIDRAVLDVLFNKNIPTEPAGYVYGRARLPIEIPNADAEVDLQCEDVPNDTVAPTYALGAGITY
jgi:beta-glucosidase